MLLKPAPRRIVPAPWLPAMRQRLPFFQLLTLVVAAVPLYGVGFTLGVDLSDPWRTGLTLPAFGLPLLWAYGYRRGRLSLAWLIPEAGVYLAFMAGVRDDYGAFGVMYFALQHRALFGTRREATTVAVAYAITLVGGYALIPQGLSAGSPITLIEVAVGGCAAYMMHTLAEMLQRDRERGLQLRESEQRFRSVIENLREALVITGPDDVITLVNRRVSDLLGYAPEELIGRPVTMLVPEGAPRELFRQRLAKRKLGEPELYEAALVHRDGRLIRTEISGAPYRDATGDIVGTVAAVTDLSARRHLQDRLRHATRLEAIGQLAGRVAHDFNNLLTVVKVHTELLLPDTRPGSPENDSVIEIARSADRGAHLTRQLLAFSRKQLLRPRRILLDDVVARAEAILRDLVDDRVSVAIVRDAAGAAIRADPEEVEEILLALVRHASDSLLEGGLIEIRTEKVAVGAIPPVSGQEMPAGDYIVLRVSDNGPATPPERIPFLFDPFTASVDPGLGSGLELAGAFGAARQSGAYVSADSVPGKGNMFAIWFPVAEAGPSASVTDPTLPHALVS